MPVLQARNLTKRFGGLVALDDLDMDVSEGEILGLIGPNGAGKSTALNMIGGTFFPTKGKIIYRNRDISRMSRHRRAGLGIARVFQRSLVFRSLTVAENISAGLFMHHKKSAFEILYKNASARRNQRAEREIAVEILRFVGLSEYADELAVNLPHGKQRCLCLAVALSTEPDLLLLDEPLTGMNVQETTAMMNLIKGLRQEKGITVIVVEHNIKAVLGLCDRTVVLDYGRKIAEGPPEEVVRLPQVIEAYLGVEQDAV